MDLLNRTPENKKENRIGIYLTVIFHLVLIIIMLCTGIHTVMKSETSFVLDFSGIEAEEKLARKEEIKENVSKELEEILSGRSHQTIRNVAVDRSSRAGERLKDDRGANSVYDEARKVQAKLDAAKAEMEKAAESEGDVAIKKGGKATNSNESYKGPSVISYTLDGRKAIRLPIPAYKCYGGGDVTVAITVNRSGRVEKAEVVPSLSSKDQCLIDYAIKAAKLSRFTASDKAPKSQIGEIVYRFVEQ